MMVAIKIECGCGQHYAFDVEPINGRLASSVACPVCGADGTDAANAAIAQSLAPEPSPGAATRSPLRVAVPAAASLTATPPREMRPAPLLPGQIDHTQAEHEARAKISWGDPPNEVIKFLMLQGFTVQDASALVQELFKERVATIRGNGIKKIISGIFLACVPIAAWFIFMSVGYILVKTFAVTIMVGLYGVYMIFKGIFMLVAPKAEAGDVAEQ